MEVHGWIDLAQDR